MRYEIYLTRKAKKELDRLDPQTQERILEALITLRNYGFTARLDNIKFRVYRSVY